MTKSANLYQKIKAKVKEALQANTNDKASNMTHSIEVLVKSATQYTNSNKPKRHLDELSKIKAADSLGLKIVSTAGSYNMVVGEHPDLPNCIIKIIPKNDRYAGFAKWMLEQEVQPTCFPKVFSLSELPSAFLVVVEKIPNDTVDRVEVDYIDEALTFEETYYDEYPHLNYLIECCFRLQKDVGGSFDTHIENFMQRDDGTLVFIDPLWS